jgi:hypothetical protein
VRHSESFFLSEAKPWKEQHPKEAYSHDEWYMKHDDFALKPKYVDPELSERGIEICEQFDLESIKDIHPTVFVSPF